MIKTLRPPAAAHYGHTYESKKRLASYWHQVDECLEVGGNSVLVVGKGSGLPSIMLERRGFEVTTVDIQKDLNPGVLADVNYLPFLSHAFDVAVCCEVLEHMPFECFLPAIHELRRVVRRGVVISLPDRSSYSRILPYIFLRQKIVIDLPNLWPKSWMFDGEHYWEIGTRYHRVSDIRSTIIEAPLKVEHTFRVWEFPYHRFWRLRVV